MTLIQKSLVAVALTSAIWAGSPIQAAGAPMTAADAAIVVASQGGVSVTLADVDAFAASRIPEKDRFGFFNSPERIQTLVTNLLQQKQLAAEAKQAGLQNDPVVKAQIELAAEEVLAKLRLADIRKDVKLPDFSQRAKEEYLAHKEKYAIPGKLDVKHVLISTSSRSEEDARKLADQVDKEARAQPDQFDSLVDKYSDDPSKSSNHGLMTEAGSDRYVREFSNAAKALKKPGDISPVVKSDYGFHILKLVDRTPDTQRTFDQVKEEIVKQLSDEYVANAVKDRLDQLRGQKLDANPDAVASLRTRFGEQPAAEQK